MSLELGRSSAAREDDDDSESAEVSDADAESSAKQPTDEETSYGAPRRSVLAPFMTAGSTDDSLPEGASDDVDEDSDDVASDTDDEDAIASQAVDEETAAASDADDTTSSGVPRQGDADDRRTFGASGEGSLVTDAASSAAAAARSVPVPRNGATEPRLDSGGLGKADADADEPLLEDAEELRTNWLRLQAGFVDDPHEAVSDAADLVEHTAQALVGALRKRQQELREVWDGGRSQGDGTADADGDRQGAQPMAADTTEQLRLLMKRYRVLFNHICRS